MNFKKHPQETNKLPDQVRVNEEQWASKQSVHKNHHRAAKRATQNQRAQNPLIERMFHILVKHVKNHAQNQSLKSNRVCIEIDFKPHPLNVDTLYCIQTAQCYFALKCTILNDYKIDYRFCNCPYEVELTKLFKTMALTNCLEPFRCNTSYANFHNRSLQVQPERFIKLL